MKKLIITQLEIVNATPPTVFPYFTPEAWTIWFNRRLQNAGFDMKRPIRQCKSFDTDYIIFEQEDE